MYLSLLMLAVISGPILYIVVTFFGKKVESVEEYFVANRNISIEQFIDSTVMYGLQVAAITLFATWGYQFGFWVILVPIFWALGYYILSVLIRKKIIDSFLCDDEIGTILACPHALDRFRG